MPKLLLVLLVAAPPAAPAIPSAAVDALRAVAVAASGDPPIEAVQAAAARVALGGGGDPASLPARVRWSAVLPRLTAEFRHLQQSNRTVGLSSSGEVDYLRLTPGTTVSLRATWDLPDLVAPRGELAASRAAADAARRRTDAALRATALHFERRRRRVALLLTPPEDARARAEAELELARLTAELDALTGGLYSGAAR
jgi:hypothetical protein